MLTLSALFAPPTRLPGLQRGFHPVVDGVAHRQSDVSVALAGTGTCERACVQFWAQHHVPPVPSHTLTQHDTTPHDPPLQFCGDAHCNRDSDRKRQCVRLGLDLGIRHALRVAVALDDGLAQRNGDLYAHADGYSYKHAHGDADAVAHAHELGVVVRVRDVVAVAVLVRFRVSRRVRP